MKRKTKKVRKPTCLKLPLANGKMLLVSYWEGPKWLRTYKRLRDWLTKAIEYAESK